jgi:hypothetical protein
MRLAISIILCLMLMSVVAQPTGKIRFKRSGLEIFFFQKGKKSDTIIKEKSDEFYIHIPDALKDSVSILTDNAQLSFISDTIVRIGYFPGLKYESLYLQSDEFRIDSTNNEKRYNFRTFINGTSDFERKKIRVTFYNKLLFQTILMNEFYYREN